MNINYVILFGKTYPTREITLPSTDGTITIGTEKLNEDLFTRKKGKYAPYASYKAKVIDESIAFFVPESVLMNTSDVELVDFVLSSW